MLLTVRTIGIFAAIAWAISATVIAVGGLIYPGGAAISVAVSMLFYLIAGSIAVRTKLVQSVHRLAPEHVAMKRFLVSEALLYLAALILGGITVSGAWFRVAHEKMSPFG